MLFHRSLIFGVAAAALLATTGTAADFSGGGVDPIYDSPLFNFEGFYVGATGGLGAFPAPGFVWTLGGVAGANFALTDAFLAGVEFQGDGLWNGGGFVGFNTMFLGKLGGYLDDNMIAYGTGGAGVISGVGSYGIGAGVEMAVAEQLSVRGEAMVTGTWSAWPNGGKASVGVLWHMN